MANERERRRKGPRTESPEAPRASLLWFGWLGGAAAWAIYHVMGYALVEVRCHSSLFSFEAFGTNGASFLGMTMAIVAAAVAVAAGVTSFRHWTDRTDFDTADPAGPEWRGRSHFMGLVGTLLSGLFVLSIAAHAVAYFYLRPC